MQLKNIKSQDTSVAKISLISKLKSLFLSMWFYGNFKGNDKTNKVLSIQYRDIYLIIKMIVMLKVDDYQTLTL